MQDMAFVPIDQDTATFATMAHLPIFHANAQVFCYPFDQAVLALLIHLYILRLHLLSNRERRLSQECLFLLQSLYPALHCSQHVQNQGECLIFLALLVPITIQRRFETAFTDECCSSFPGYLD